MNTPAPSRPPLTKAEMFAQIRALGLTATVTSGEVRVNYRKSEGGCEDSAYYTDDYQDAVDTARAMAAK